MKTLIIANPASGSFNKPLLDRCAQLLSKKVGAVEIALTKSQNDATNIAYASDAEFVIAAGGDGLINEVTKGLHTKKNTIFTALPFGTRNVYCREFNIPLNPIKAVELINLDRTKHIPIGFIGDGSFVLMCGLGYDAAVVKRVVEKGYKSHKTAAHIVSGVASLHANYPKLTLYTNNKMIPAYHAVVSLVRNYAGSFPLAENIEYNMLNTFILQDTRKIELLTVALRMALGHGFKYPSIVSDIVKVSGTRYVQLDGEFFDTGSEQNYITVKRDALNVLY